MAFQNVCAGMSLRKAEMKIKMLQKDEAKSLVGFRGHDILFLLGQ